MGALDAIYKGKGEEESCKGRNHNKNSNIQEWLTINIVTINLLTNLP